MQSSARRSILKYLVFSFIILSSFKSYCQVPVPTQVPTEIQPNQVDPKTLSQTQLSSLLSDKNKENAGKDKNAELEKSTKLDKDSLIKDNIKANSYRPDQTYGIDVFRGAASFDLSELSTPPLDYPIGVGDHIVVSLWGAAEFQESYVVARDGAIFPQGLGKIQVQGLTFDNVRSMIDARFRSAVPAGTNIAISLGQPRSITVNVVGEVISAGPITISVFSNAFNAIAQAGGVTQLEI